jgi:hypothetical protein
MGIFSKTTHTANATVVAIREVFEDNNQQGTVASQISVFAIFIFGET